MRVMYRLEQETEGTLQLFDHRFCKDHEFDVWMLVVEEFSKLGNAFSVGIGFEFETLCLQKCSELFIVGDDTVVDHAELPIGVRPVLSSSASTHTPDKSQYSCGNGFAYRWGWQLRR